jgi:FkbM family methyltransferase
MESATEQDVLACFRLLLGRSPHEEEWRGHLVNVGQPLVSVVSAYLHSLEFHNRGLLTSNSEAQTVAVNGYVIYVAKDDPLIGAAIGCGYEPEVTDVFLDHMGTGAVLDIGANCGYFTMLAASLGAKVYAFEPLQSNVRLLHASIAANRFHRVRIMAAAASNVPGTLAIGATYTNGIVNDVRPDGPLAALAADYVAAVRADDVVPPEVPVSIIKIDTEGHEFRALSGAIGIIERSRPVIITEFSPTALAVNSKISGNDYLAWLQSLGYRVSLIGDPEVNTIAAILGRCAGIDHVDLVAKPMTKP